MIQPADISVVILCGGRGSRLQGRDKGLVEIAGRPVIEHILEGIRPQLGEILINANRNTKRYAKYGYPVIRDQLGGYQGPLAGLATAMQYVLTPYLLTLPCDAPQVAEDTVYRFCKALEPGDADTAIAHDGIRVQPLHAMVPITRLPELRRFIGSGERKTSLWYTAQPHVLADFSDIPQMFANINTGEDLLHITESMNQ